MCHKLDHFSKNFYKFLVAQELNFRPIRSLLYIA